VARPFQGRLAGLKAPRYINIENALIRLDPTFRAEIGGTLKTLHRETRESALTRFAKRRSYSRSWWMPFFISPAQIR